MPNCVDEPLLSAVDERVEVKLNFPPRSQILKALRGQGLNQVFAPSALGTVQIMVGVFNIALGPGRTSTKPWDLTSLGAAYWLGAVFIVSGILSLLVGSWPSVCTLGFTVSTNIVGALFAITAIVLYVIDLQDSSLLWMCDGPELSGHLYDERCINVAFYAQRLLTLMDATMIVMAALQLFANIKLALLGLMSLIHELDEEEEVLKLMI